MNRIVPIIILILVVAGGAFWYQSQGMAPAVAPVPNVADSAPSSGNVIEGGNAINVDTQEAGDLVSIDLAVLSDPGFVVIHEATADEKPGKVVGHSDYLLAAQYTDVSIELDEPSMSGKTFIAMLHGDNGDKEYTSIDEDKPLADTQGNVVMMKFTIKSALEAPEE